MAYLLMEYIREYQLSIMLFLSGVCGILALEALVSSSLLRGRKNILTLMELCAMLLLLCDRYAYLYRGDPGALGYVMVRVSNGMVFFLSIAIPQLVSRYLRDVLLTEGKFTAAPRRLYLCDYLFTLGTLLIILTQFTGFYYTFDEKNTYHRANGYLIAFLIPVLFVLLQESILIQYRARLDVRFVRTMLLSVALPTAASIAQIFFYGVSLANMTMALMVTVFYLHSLFEMDRTAERARHQEVEFYKEARQREYAMLMQTAEALANAIDAKDAYTSGHSKRVARYSEQIARAAGFSEQETARVKLAALLHDVGKIGVPDEIINKTGKLTAEEFEQIKQHPILGDQIVSGIQQAPFLRDGTRWHHERCDGKGYPDGLSGEAIPRLARVIAVADSFDAMTSKRSYRDPLPRRVVREELAAGMGTQFDPEYAGIMLRLVDSGSV